MQNSKSKLARASAIVGAFALFACFSSLPLPAPIESVKVTSFRDPGLGCSWDRSGSNRIAYDVKGADGHYDLHLANPDGSGDLCLTCDHNSLPNKHMGAPSWHPSGTWILFVAEKSEHPGSSFEAIPGFGGYSDLWAITPDGKRVARLTDVRSDPDHGTLPGHFSPDGRRVAWTERIRRANVLSPNRAFAFWTIKIADFEETTDGARLVNIRTIQPGPESFYELSGFSHDGKRLIFCSGMIERNAWKNQIFTVDSESGSDLRQLTTEDYNEHAFFTPDGSRIVWMTNRHNRNKGTDWWIMNADGSGKRRLTFFNTPGHPHANGKAVWAGFGSFNADGTRFVGGVQKSLITQEGKIVIVELGDQ